MKLKTGVSTRVTITSIVAECEDEGDLFVLLQFLSGLVPQLTAEVPITSDAFLAIFILGPGGVNSAVDVLCMLFQAMGKPGASKMDARLYHRTYTFMKTIARDLIVLISHFKSLLAKYEYSPAGFSDLFRILGDCNSIAEFPVSLFTITCSRSNTIFY